jgi:hypothetical protein
VNYTQWYAQNGKFQKHEQWLVDNLLLETIVGSRAYGCSTEKSDYDILAIVLPKHEHLFPQKYGFVLGFDALPDFRRKELKGKKKIMIGDKPFEAEWVSLIEFFIHAGLKGSPNLIECLFVRRELVTVGTKMGWFLRDNRRLFISMKTFHAFKGYANGQMHRIRQRNPETEDRKALIEKHGFDCYIDSTEFLTNSGWKLYGDITSEKLATVDVVTGNIDFQRPLSRIIKKGIYKIYNIENNFTKFSVTGGHNILNSPCHRSRTLQYSDKDCYWNLSPIKDLSDNKRSWYHLRTSVNNNRKGLGKDLDELVLIGLYLSEGSVSYRTSRVRALRFSQTRMGKKEVFDFMRKVKSKFGLREYTYTHKPNGTFSKIPVVETVWITHKKPMIKSIYKDFGAGKNKKYPAWVLDMSVMEAEAMRYGMFLGDGTEKKIYRQEIYYSTVKNLSDLYQILALLSGYDSNIMGPYSSIYVDSKGVERTGLIYQTLVNVRKKSRPKAVCFNTTGITHTKKLKLRGGCVKKYSGNVVCFEVPNGTLITRLDGKIAVQGNCKMAYHTLRLLDQLEQILTVGDIDLMRSKEESKLMRAGEWGDFDRFDREFQRRMDHVSDLATKCKLPPLPQAGALKKLLLEILEEHYSESGVQEARSEEYISLSDVNKKFDMILEKLSKSPGA